MVGIQRLTITNKINGRGAYRFNQAKKYHAHANQVYRGLFNLMPGVEYTECSAEEKLGRYDIDFGVDILLNFLNGQTATVQEKILHTHFDTVTVEEYNDPRTGELGDWFKLKCDFYFVGYSHENKGRPALDRWILLDWDKVKLFADVIPWHWNCNQNDGARANFRYAHFWDFPKDTVLASYYNGEFVNNVPNCGPVQYSFIHNVYTRNEWGLE